MYIEQGNYKADANTAATMPYYYIDLYSAKRIGQYDLNGNFIQEFPSARQAARELNLDSSTISKVCRGKNKTHGGFIFKYLD